MDGWMDESAIDLDVCFVSNLVRLPAYERVPDAQPTREFHFCFDCMYVATMDSAVIDLCQTQPHHHLHHTRRHYYYYTKLLELLDFRCLCLLFDKQHKVSERKNVSHTKSYAFEENC